MKPNTIYIGECASVMSQWPDDCIDLTVTSPPYDDLRTYNGYEFDFEAIATQLYRITKPGGVVVWVVGDATVNGSKTGTSMRQALGFMELGFSLHDEMIYQKPAPSYPDTERYYAVYEKMFIFSNGRPKTINLLRDRINKSAGRKVTGTERKKHGGTVRKPCYGNEIRQFGVRYNVWMIKNQVNNNNKKHPATFPEALARDHILSWSNPGDVVLDPMCGSGTTLKMAKQTGRQWVGIDMSPEYVKLSEKRVRGAQPPLFLEATNDNIP